MARNRNRNRKPRRDAAAHIPHELRDSFDAFSRAVTQANERAKAAAGGGGDTSQYLDYREAIQLLNSNPPLTTYLEGVMQRQEARAQALGLNGAIPTAASYAVPGMEDSFFGTKARHGPPTGSHPQNQSNIGGWTTGGTAKNSAPQGIANAQQLRYFADNNEWVRAAINIRRQQVGRADIAVVPNDERKKWNRTIMKRVELLLSQPNIYRDSYRSLIEPVIEDILVLDRGCISKNMTAGRVPTELYYEDGATIKIFTDWSGKPKDYRYLYEETGSDIKVSLRNDELICISANPATYRTGLSPVQFLRKTIQAEMRAIESATHIVDMKPAPHIVQIPGAHQTQITNLRNNYDAEVAGRKELFWMGGDQEAKVFSLTFSARDNQWLEWQQWLARKIATAFQISLQQLNFTDSINKSTGEVQQELYEDTGLIPILLLLEEYLNREILMDFAPVDRDGRALMDSLNLRIIYPEVSEAERALHAERAAEIAEKTMAGLPTATINQILMMRGEEPVAGGNTFWVETAAGPTPWLSYDHDYGDWTPYGAIGGVLGGQDPLGGLEPLLDDPDSGPNEKPAAPAAPDSSTSAGNESSAASDNVDTSVLKNSATTVITQHAKATKPESTKRKTNKQYDTRRPGARWNPARKYYQYDDEAE
ncbi:MAG: phage portal protein [Ktedonobacterales bacterium]